MRKFFGFYGFAKLDLYEMAFIYVCFMNNFDPDKCIVESFSDLGIKFMRIFG